MTVFVGYFGGWMGGFLLGWYILSCYSQSGKTKTEFQVRTEGKCERLSLLYNIPVLDGNLSLSLERKWL